MKNLLYSLAALAGLTITAAPAAAQYPAPGGVTQAGCTQCGNGYPGFPGYAHGGFGFKDKLHGHSWLGGKLHSLFGNHGHGGGPKTLPVVDPRSGNAGQLAFPQNPFVRGPRDYFMWDER